MKLDALDKRILRSLQRNGRLQNIELAKEVGLSPSPCLRRTRILEEEGIIARYTAILDPKKIDQALTVYAQVWLSNQTSEVIEHFIHEIKLLPQITECHLMAGNSDFLLKIVAADLDDYRRFQMGYLSRIRGVQNIKTEIPLQTIKSTTELPL